MGAAQDVHDRILALLAEKDEINMIFRRSDNAGLYLEPASAAKL